MCTDRLYSYYICIGGGGGRYYMGDVLVDNIYSSLIQGLIGADGKSKPAKSSNADIKKEEDEIN